MIFASETVIEKTYLNIWPNGGRSLCRYGSTKFLETLRPVDSLSVETTVYGEDILDDRVIFLLENCRGRRVSLGAARLVLRRDIMNMLRKRPSVGDGQHFASVINQSPLKSIDR